MRLLVSCFILLFLPLTGLAEKRMAQPLTQIEDYSGVYQCTGDDAHEGAYTGTVTLERISAHSHDQYASYRFKLEVPGYGTYLGHAAVQGHMAAMHFALTDPSTKDYGTGVAQFSHNKSGELTFHKFYYEPEFKGGNTGLEDCVRKN